jgi:hypothetical protein
MGIVLLHFTWLADPDHPDPPLSTPAAAAARTDIFISGNGMFPASGTQREQAKRDMVSMEEEMRQMLGGARKTR